MNEQQLEAVCKSLPQGIASSYCKGEYWYLALSIDTTPEGMCTHPNRILSLTAMQFEDHVEVTFEPYQSEGVSATIENHIKLLNIMQEALTKLGIK